MSNKIRVRFAPSPTGPLHIGGVRTALYNYLYARKYKGDFILRIEDTDQNRFEPEAEKYIIDSFNWLGIQPNEGYGIGGDFGPYKQSERLPIYKEHIDLLLDKNKAYYAFDTLDELKTLREKCELEKSVFSYDSSNREALNNSLNIGKESALEKIKSGLPYVIRFLTPKDRVLKLEDEVRGQVEINTNTLDDKVLFKSDGFPTYHLANVVDDHLMKISHVIRGEEWLPSLALHNLLYEAFGWDKPKFAHLPLLLKPEGKGKLSKRDADKGGFPIFPLQWKEETGGYKEEGFLPEAVINLLAFLGWNPGTEQEVFNLEELVNSFSLRKVSKSGAKFSYDKAKFFNQEHLKLVKNEMLVEKLSIWEGENGFSTDKNFQENVVELMLPRAVFLKDIWQNGHFFYKSPSVYDEKALKKVKKDKTKALLVCFSKKINEIEVFVAENIKKELNSFVNEQEIGFGNIMQPLRVAVCGSLSGPDLFTVFEMLGKSEIQTRINTFLEIHFS